MNLAAIWFTCGRDADVLALSAESVLRVHPEATLIAVEDAKDSLPSDYDWPGERILGGDHGVHLNGRDAVASMLWRFSDMRHRYDWLLKIDSDTLWMRKGVLWRPESMGEPTWGDSSCSIIGHASLGRIAGRWSYASGCAYFLRLSALEFLDGLTPAEISAQLARFDLQSGHMFGDWSEDMVVTTFVPAQSGTRRCLSPFGVGLDLYHLGRPAHEYEDADFMEFGRLIQGSDGTREGRIERRHAVMKSFLDGDGSRWDQVD